MRCVRCECEAGYNRAVIELYSRTTVGGLCMNCERDEFGRTFEYPNHGPERQCKFCRRDGYVLFPRYLPRTESASGDLVVQTSIESDDTAPCLCDEHFHAVLDVEPSTKRVEP